MLYSTTKSSHPHESLLSVTVLFLTGCQLLLWLKILILTLLLKPGEYCQKTSAGTVESQQSHVYSLIMRNETKSGDRVLLVKYSLRVTVEEINGCVFKHWIASEWLWLEEQRRELVSEHVTSYSFSSDYGWVFCSNSSLTYLIMTGEISSIFFVLCLFYCRAVCPQSWLWFWQRNLDRTVG